jgi:DNA segregation ATPase FtsK/SpoIIIE-like protein
MTDEFEAPDSPFIRIARNGAVTKLADDRDGIRTRAPRDITSESENDAPFAEEFEQEYDRPITRVRGERPMPRRLSEEARDVVAQASERPSAAPKPRASRTTKTAPKKEAEQIPLPLKTPRPKPDSMVKQRQVLGFCCVIAAVLVLIAIISYSPDDASRAETKFSDLPSLFLPHSDHADPVREAVRANADQAKNWLGLIGAMLADFLINKTIGYAAIIYPIFFGAWSLAFFRFTYKQRRRLTLATTFFLITAILFSATAGTASNFIHMPGEWSGSVGQFLGLAFARLIGTAGAFIIYGAAFVVMLVFSIDLDIERTFLRMKGWWNAFILFSRRKIIEFWDKREAKRLVREERKAEEAEREREAEEREQEASLLEEVQAQEIQPVVEAAIPSPVKKPELEAPAKKISKILETPVVKPPVAIEPIAIAPIESAVLADPIRPIEPQNQNRDDTPRPVVQKVTPGQPLLKVRPATKSEAGTPIPRMTRQDRDRLGERSKHFSRLTNGAIQNEPAAPAPLPARVDSVALLAVPPMDAVISPSTDVIAEDAIYNINTSEEVINPFASGVIHRAAKFQATLGENIMGVEPPIVVGDEKVLSNEALPHSVTEEYADVVRDHQALSKLAAKNSIPSIPDIEEDLFIEEGRKTVIPENPYMEMLTKFRNPSFDILTPADPKDALDADDEELAKKGRLLRDKLATFGVEIENITVTPGPVVTLYEFTPAEGVKVSRVENLTDDIALAMKARGIRIIAPIPGRGTIGVEIPNDVPKMVRIRPLFESESFRNTKMNLPLALGKTISGDVYVDDLNKMPHLLIAGATGSGKSVGVNGIIASLLYAKSPRDVKFVIIDPKKIELSLYKKLRKHYLIVSPEAGEDIVTTPAYAVLALKAVEIEMERRYDKLAKAAVRSLADYNIKVAQGKLRSTQEEQHYHLPYIVVVIDELADLMITAAREIEEPICRIAQMARAVGIHLILATQRPSVDVITGVIKANFPARMAYQVATRVDSRTILDSMGAEQLLGNGDMLYQPSGTPKAIRLQSPFISTEEVEAIIDAVAVQEGDKLSYSRPWTLPSLRQKEGKGGSYGDEEEGRDPLFEDAAQVVVRHQQGSVSLLQRRLKVGYSRAARIMDELEQAAVVGAFDGSKARQVLCETEAELEVVLDGLR